MNHFHTWPFGMGVNDSWLFVLLKFAFIGLVLWFILWILKFFLEDGKKHNQKVKEDPIEILKIRLAKGEINLDEFEKLKKEISKGEGN